MTAIDVYGQENCRFCKDAVAYLELHKLPFVYRDLKSAADLTEMLRRNPKAKQVPQIFIGETHIGGCSELIVMPLSQLQQMIGE